MAKQNYADDFLHAITQEVIAFLLKNVNATRIKCILVTGSLANGEGTVVEYKTHIVTSDFDFVIYLDSQYFLKNKALFKKLSQKITTILMKRGIATHVDFLPSDPCFRHFFKFLNSNIYEYEFSLASKCVLGNPPIFDKNVRPSRNDALELALTVASDLVFSEFKYTSELENSYIYAKRALTLLNSILIFQGVFAETYAKRLEAAKEHVTRGLGPLSKTDWYMLRLFTEYKLYGSLKNLMSSLKCTQLSSLIDIEKEFLKKLTLKSLFYEFMILTNDQKQKLNSSILHEKISPESISSLIRLYFKKSHTSLISRIAGTLIYAISFLNRDRDRSELFATFVFRGQSPKTILNYMILLMLIHGKNISTLVLNREFPWVKINGSAFKKIFSLWILAEQSIKLD